MSGNLVFVGDIHANLDALTNLVNRLEVAFQPYEIIFLGDYINRGPNSAGVLDFLIELGIRRRITTLAGNHELAFLAALEDDGHMPKFLKMGGADTIRSYHRRPLPPAVGPALRNAVPEEHLRFLRRLADHYESEGIYAHHKPILKDRYTIAGHRPVGDYPWIKDNGAFIDTGCDGRSGRLTAFAWPQKEYIQVDHKGRAV